VHNETKYHGKVYGVEAHFLSFLILAIGKAMWSASLSSQFNNGEVITDIHW
jgi:hypothetical protein